MKDVLNFFSFFGDNQTKKLVIKRYLLKNFVPLKGEYSSNIWLELHFDYGFGTEMKTILSNFSRFYATGMVWPLYGNILFQFYQNFN